MYKIVVVDLRDSSKVTSKLFPESKKEEALRHAQKIKSTGKLVMVSRQLSGPEPSPGSYSWEVINSPDYHAACFARQHWAPFCLVALGAALGLARWRC